MAHHTTLLPTSSGIRKGGAEFDEEGMIGRTVSGRSSPSGATEASGARIMEMWAELGMPV